MISDKKQTPAGLPVKGFVVNASTWNIFMGLFIAYSILSPWLTVPTSGHSATYRFSSLCITAVNEWLQEFGLGVRLYIFRKLIFIYFCQF